MQRVSAHGRPAGRTGLSASLHSTAAPTSGFFGPNAQPQSRGGLAMVQGAPTGVPVVASMGQGPPTMHADAFSERPATARSASGSLRTSVNANAITSGPPTAAATITTAETPRLPQSAPLAMPVAVLPQRVPSRRGEVPIAPREEVGALLPEFQFTDRPSWLRRALVILIMACVSPSLLKEDPFPPLRQIISRQAPFRGGG